MRRGRREFPGRVRSEISVSGPGSCDAGPSTTPGGAMRLTELVVSELDLEAEYTRRHLERVPMERLDFKAHDKSSPLGMIASFVAILPTWGGAVLMSDAYDVAPEGVPVQEPKVMETRRELLETFD